MVDVYYSLQHFMSEYGSEASLYIVDIGLPDGSGFDIIKMIREQKHFSAPIIITSGYDDPEKKIYGFDVII